MLNHQDVRDHYVDRDIFVLPTYPLKHRLARLIWNFVWLIFFRFSPRFAFGWRRLLLRAFGATIGQRAKVYPTTIIWAPWNIIMEDESCFGPGVDVYSMNKVFIGYRATVSQRSFICCGSHDVYSDNFDLVTKPINILEHAWVASEAFVGPGVTIGKGAVVAARACVIRNVEDDLIVAGVPAIPVGNRSKKK